MIKTPKERLIELVEKEYKEELKIINKCINEMSFDLSFSERLEHVSFSYDNGYIYSGHKQVTQIFDSFKRILKIDDYSLITLDENITKYIGIFGYSISLEYSSEDLNKCFLYIKGHYYH